MEEIADYFLSKASVGGLTGIILLILFGISLCVEISPKIKWNPLTSILKWIGKRVNGEVVQKVEKLETQVHKIQYDNARRSAITCRVRILQFGDELRQDQKHSKESFEQILEDIDNYEKYCHDHPEFKNNRTQLTTKKIKEVYKDTMDKNDFL